MRYGKRDARDIKNEFATYDQVDERQSVELLVLLEKWENAQMAPWDVLLAMSHTVGARPSALIGYEVSLEHGPGTENNRQAIEKTRSRIKTKYDLISFEALKNLKDLKQRIGDLSAGYTQGRRRNMFGSEIDSDKIKSAQKPLAEVLKDEKERQDSIIAKYPDLANTIKITDDIMGDTQYVEALQEMIRIRDEAIVNNNLAFQLFAESAILETRLNKKLATYDFEHIEDRVAEAKAEAQASLAQSIESLKARMRPEVIEHDRKVAINIRMIKKRLEEGEFDSWTAALAMAEVLWKPEAEHTDAGPSALADFKEMLERERGRLSSKKQDIEKTLKLFKPIDEDDIKKPLAYEYAYNRAFSAWREAAKPAFLAEWQPRNPGKTPDAWTFGLYLGREKFEKAGKPGMPPEGEEIPFAPPINYPDRILCNELYIEPAGTGLIEVYERSEHDQAHDSDIYGNSVARITTYSVSFIARTSADIEPLRKTLLRAMRLVGQTPYKYVLPGYTPSGKSYARVSGVAEKNEDEGYYRGYYDEDTASSHITVQGDRLRPDATFDLDDLWLLYFFMEKVIEPNAQIAAAMNSARYAEERGAILKPVEFDYVNKGHKVADEVGVMKKDELDRVAAAVRDALIARALDKIDDAQWTLQMQTIGQHTLSGRMLDIHGAFPVFDAMIADQRAEGRRIMTYDEALQHRTHDLMRAVLGLAKDSEVPIAAALHRVLAQISGPLKEKYRGQSEQERRVFYERLDAYFDRSNSRSGNFLSSLAQVGNETDIAFDLSDAFAGFAGRTEEQVKEAKKKALARGSNIALFASAVEPAIDGIHAGGRYLSRTKGAPWVRYELPKSLAPFAPQQKYQPTRFALPNLHNL